MKTRTEAIRAAARRLLTDDVVDCVIGYARSSVPLMPRPFIAYTPEEADLLVWDSFCGLNTANFTQGRTDRMAVVAQGCASRNLNGLLHENKLDADRLHVIGVPCLGMLDRRKVEAKLPGTIILETEDDGDELVVRGLSQAGERVQERIKRRDLGRDNCNTCLHRNPVNADETVADPVDEQAGGNIDFMAAPWEKLDQAGRWAAFTETFKSCIRCYACRDACPLCYCPTCFVDEAKPQWCGKTQDPADVQTFHILRAFHCAGRCTDCGACETACPQGIKMRRLTSMLEKDVRRLYGHEPGMDPDAEVPLATYQPDDPQEHFE